jgi:hypothetical protein
MYVLGGAYILQLSYGGSYVLSRVITINVEEALGAFGTQWLLIESVLCGLALLLLLLQRKTTTQRY